jgi:hypothetical protein
MSIFQKAAHLFRSSLMSTASLASTNGGVRASGAALAHVMVPRTETYHVGPGFLRPGAWVVTADGQTGIFHRIVNVSSINGVPVLMWDLHLTDENGDTSMTDTFVEPYSVRLAKRSEIPAKRFFPGLHKDQQDFLCKRMGYE